jgi:hypothetical protein
VDVDDEFLVMGNAHLVEDAVQASRVRNDQKARGMMSTEDERLFRFDINRVMYAKYGGGYGSWLRSIWSRRNPDAICGRYGTVETAQNNLSRKTPRNVAKTRSHWPSRRSNSVTESQPTPRSGLDRGHGLQLRPCECRCDAASRRLLRARQARLVAAR